MAHVRRRKPEVRLLGPQRAPATGKGRRKLEEGASNQKGRREPKKGRRYPQTGAGNKETYREPGKGAGNPEEGAGTHTRAPETRQGLREPNYRASIARICVMRTAQGTALQGCLEESGKAAGNQKRAPEPEKRRREPQRGSANQQRAPEMRKGHRNPKRGAGSAKSCAGYNETDNRESGAGSSKIRRWL